MKVLVVDVDSQEKIGNMASRKLDGFFTDKGHTVEVLRLFYSGYPSKRHDKVIIDARDYDEVWVSIIFKINKNVVEVINCDTVYYGGTGIDITAKLPQEIDDYRQDYSAYPDVEEHTDFITRGCIRNCYFCVVRQKEGYIYQYRTVDQIVSEADGRPRLIFKWSKSIRLITDENARLISLLNWGTSEYVFAFDDLKYMKMINRQVKIIQKYITGEWKLKFYIYTHPKMPFSDILTRIHWCKKHKFLPYVMRDESCYYSEYSDFYTDITAWCNQARHFKKMTFEQFMVKRTKNENRRKSSMKLYLDNMEWVNP